MFNGHLLGKLKQFRSDNVVSIGATYDREIERDAAALDCAYAGRFAAKVGWLRRLPPGRHRAAEQVNR